MPTRIATTNLNHQWEFRSRGETGNSYGSSDVIYTFECVIHPGEFKKLSDVPNASGTILRKLNTDPQSNKTDEEINDELPHDIGTVAEEMRDRHRGGPGGIPER